MNGKAAEPATPTPQDQVTPLAAPGEGRRWTSRLLLALILFIGAVTGLLWAVGLTFDTLHEMGSTLIVNAHTRDLAMGLAAVVAVASVASFVGLRKHQCRVMVLGAIVPMQVGALGWLLSAL